MTDNLNQVLFILFTPLVLVIMFQISSLLNQTVLASGMAALEIKDFSALTGIPEERIRMLPMPDEKIKFKILDPELKKNVDEVIFSLETLKVVEANGIEIDNARLQELRRQKFAKVVRIPQEKIRISEDGNTFTEVLVDKDGNEKVNGKVIFGENDKPVEVTGSFKKFF